MDGFEIILVVTSIGIIAATATWFIWVIGLLDIFVTELEKKNDRKID